MAEDELDRLCIDTIQLPRRRRRRAPRSGHGPAARRRADGHVLWTRFLPPRPGGSGWWTAILRAVGRTRIGAAVRAPAPLGLRPSARGAAALSPARGRRTSESHLGGRQATTGPLGRGLANAVGMAIGEANLAARYRRARRLPPPHLRAGQRRRRHGGQRRATSLAVTSKARTAGGALRRQPREPLGRRVDHVHQDVVRALRLRLARGARGRRQRSAALGRHDRRRRRDGAPIADRRPAVLGYGSPDKAGPSRRTGRRSGPDSRHQAQPRVAADADPAIPPGPPRASGRRRPRRERRRPGARGSPTRAPTPAHAREIERRFAARLPDGWADHCRISRPTRKVATRSASEACCRDRARGARVVGGSEIWIRRRSRG